MFFLFSSVLLIFVQLWWIGLNFLEVQVLNLKVISDQLCTDYVLLLVITLQPPKFDSITAMLGELKKKPVVAKSRELGIAMNKAHDAIQNR